MKTRKVPDHESENEARRKLIERIRDIREQQKTAQGNSALNPTTSASQIDLMSRLEPRLQDLPTRDISEDNQDNRLFWRIGAHGALSATTTEKMDIPNLIILN